MNSRESWRSRVGFVLAAMGSAVGLASIVRFPYLVADHGGAAFVLVYLLSLLILGIPILLAEVALGCATQKNCYGAFAVKGEQRIWKGSGLWVLLTALVVSSFYSALSGWICGYVIEAMTGRLQSLQTTAIAQEHFNSLLQHPGWGLGYHAVFLGSSVALLYAGVRQGIEKGCKILMPVLLLTLLILVARGLTLDRAGEALNYLFLPRWSDLNSEVILMALGQAFFTLSLGQGTMITYGSYLPRGSSFVPSCIAVALSVVLVSLFSSVAIFTTVFSADLKTQGGLGLMFEVLPVVFQQMEGGAFLSVVFFVLVALAALTSEISALEPVVAYLVDERGWVRKKAVLMTGALAFVIGIPCALASNVLSRWTLSGKNILELFDLVATTVLVPIGGLLGVLLVGWRWEVASTWLESEGGVLVQRPLKTLYFVWCIKYIAPFVILLIFISNLS